MGTFQSTLIADMSSEDVAEYVGSIGTAFEPYREVIIENAVNGIKILDFSQLRIRKSCAIF
jgi:hypothetical protein